MQSGDLNGKVALVTGAPPGICRAVTNGLKGHGAVIATAQALENVAAIARAFDVAQRTHGPVAIVVHVLDSLPELNCMTELPLETYDRITHQLAKVPFFLLQQSARLVQPGGRVILVQPHETASIAHGGAVHAGAAAATQVYARVLTREVGARRITVNTVSASIDSEAGRKGASSRDTHDAEVDDLVALIIFLAGPDGRWINGQHLQSGSACLT